METIPSPNTSETETERVPLNVVTRAQHGKNAEAQTDWNQETQTKAKPKTKRRTRSRGSKKSKEKPQEQPTMLDDKKRARSLAQEDL